MAVMHAHGVVHADLKPENILLRRPVQEGSSGCPEVVITDFGSAFSTSETDTSWVACEMQTLPYRAPEVGPLPPSFTRPSSGCLAGRLLGKPCAGPILWTALRLPVPVPALPWSLMQSVMYCMQSPCNVAFMQVVAGHGVTLGAALDVWSLGCILAELVLKRPLFPCNTPSQLLTQVCRQRQPCHASMLLIVSCACVSVLFAIVKLRERWRAWQHQLCVANRLHRPESILLYIQAQLNDPSRAVSIRLWLVLQMEHMLNLPPEGQRCSIDHCFVTTDLSHASHGRDGASPHGDKDLIAKLAEEAMELGRSTPEQAMSSWQGRLRRLGLELAKVRAFLIASDLRRIE